MKTIPYSKFKHGQRVTCEIDGVKINNAKISIDLDGTVYICQNVKEGSIAENKFDYQYSFSIADPIYDLIENARSCLQNLKFLPRTLDDLEEGDVVVTPFEGEIKVLGVCNSVYFLSKENDFDTACRYYYTIKELKKLGYTLKQDIEEEEQIQELTLQEIADKMGIPVEKLRIKD